MNIVTLIEKKFRWFKNIPLLPILLDEQLKLATFIFMPLRYYKMKEFTKLVKQKPNIVCVLHKYGGLQFNLHDIEIGHLHGNGLLDLKLDSSSKQEIMSRYDYVENHHVNVTSNWVSIEIRSSSNLDDLISIFNKAYERL